MSTGANTSLMSFDPCGTHESSGGCETCPLAAECLPPSPEPTLEDLLEMEEGWFTEDVPVILERTAEAQRGFDLRRPK